MYHMILGESLIDIAARVCARVVCVCVYVWEGEVFHITHCLVCELE